MVRVSRGSVRVGSAVKMVNYKRALCEGLVVLALAGLVGAAPAADCAEKQHHYDQRQNGSENYRLNIDGVVIAVAPAESLLAAASDIDFSDLLELGDLSDLTGKPPSLKPPSEVKPQEQRPPSEPLASPAGPPEPKPDPQPPLSDVSIANDNKEQKKELKTKKQEKAQRLKMRLANMLLPLLRRNLHHHQQ